MSEWDEADLRRWTLALWLILECDKTRSHTPFQTHSHADTMMRTPTHILSHTLSHALSRLTALIHYQGGFPAPNVRIYPILGFWQQDRLQLILNNLSSYFSSFLFCSLTNSGIRTIELWFGRRPLYQLGRNHFSDVFAKVKGIFKSLT